MNFFKSIGTTSLALLLALSGALVGCGSAPIKRTPTPLQPLAESRNLAQVWQFSLGSAIDFPLQMSTSRDVLGVAASNGLIALINPATGTDIWRLKVNANLSSGFGFDGKTGAVTTVNNELIAISVNAQNIPSIAWRKPLPARAYTAPLVAGGRVFVLTGDRSIHAFDADTGVKLWSYERASEPLILSDITSLGVYHNTLLAGHSGRLLGINPDNGQLRWELSMATSRATNDIERLIDLVGAPNRVGDSVCVRSFQTSISCADLAKGVTAWSRPTQGVKGVSGDETMLVSTESDGRVKAWNRLNGDLLWTNDKLAYRNLSAPLLIGRSIIVGDAQGYVHVINKTSGEVVARFKTDDSAIIAAPVVIGDTVMVATAKGGIYAYRPK